MRPNKVQVEETECKRQKRNEHIQRVEGKFHTSGPPCGPGVDPVWTRCGPGVEPVWTRCGPGVEPVWTRCGPGVEPVWTRCGSYLVLA